MRRAVPSNPTLKKSAWDFFSTLLGLAAAITLSAGGDAWAADVDLSSFTALRLFTRDAPIGPDLDYAPLYERISLSALGLGGNEISAYANVWGRLDLGEETGDGKSAGSVNSAFLAYNGQTADIQARLGRFFLTEGTLADTIDGVFLKARGRLGMGAAIFAGRPVQDTEDPPKDAGSLAGGRLFFARPSWVEGGVTFLRGQRLLANGEDREEVGADLWIRPVRIVTITGEGVRNRATSRTASTRASVAFAPSDGLTLSVGAESYAYGDLLGSALNPAFSISALSFDDEVDITSATLEWQATDRIALVARGRRINHLLDDPGDATRGEVQFRLGLGAERSAGLSAARQSADLPENAFREVRGYVMAARGPWSVSLDALAITYDEPIAGEKNTIQVVGSTGRRLGPSTRIYADARYTSSPTFKEDIAVVVRLETGMGKE